MTCAKTRLASLETKAEGSQKRYKIKQTDRKNVCVAQREIWRRNRVRRRLTKDREKHSAIYTSGSQCFPTTFCSYCTGNASSNGRMHNSRAAEYTIQCPKLDSHKRSQTCDQIPIRSHVHWIPPSSRNFHLSSFLPPPPTPRAHPPLITHPWNQHYGVIHRGGGNSHRRAFFPGNHRRLSAQKRAHYATSFLPLAALTRHSFFFSTASATPRGQFRADARSLSKLPVVNHRRAFHFALAIVPPRRRRAPGALLQQPLFNGR